MEERKIIEKLLEEHLIAWYKNAMPVMKAHYLVTGENLADFIDSYFVRRKVKKAFKKVLQDSRSEEETK